MIFEHVFRQEGVDEYLSRLSLEHEKEPPITRVQELVDSLTDLYMKYKTNERPMYFPLDPYYEPKLREILDKIHVNEFDKIIFNEFSKKKKEIIIHRLITLYGEETVRDPEAVAIIFMLMIWLLMGYPASLFAFRRKKGNRWLGSIAREIGAYYNRVPHGWILKGTKEIAGEFPTGDELIATVETLTAAVLQILPRGYLGSRYCGIHQNITHRAQYVLSDSVSV